MPAARSSQVASSTNQGIFNITNNGLVGIGTTTPGSIFSINNVANFSTGTSTLYSNFSLLNLNVSGTATSTFANGINIATGCFSVNGTCLGSGGGGTVTSVVAGSGLSGGTITHTGTISLNLANANSWDRPPDFR